MILYDISHANLLMLSAATPSYDFDDDSKTHSLEDLEWGGQLDGDNPENFTDTKDRQRI